MVRQSLWRQPPVSPAPGAVSGPAGSGHHGSQAPPLQPTQRGDGTRASTCCTRGPLQGGKGTGHTQAHFHRRSEAHLRPIAGTVSAGGPNYHPSSAAVRGLDPPSQNTACFRWPVSGNDSRLGPGCAHRGLTCLPPTSLRAIIKNAPPAPASSSPIHPGLVTKEAGGKLWSSRRLAASSWLRSQPGH